MDLSQWEAAQLLIKALVYFSICALAGGAWSLCWSTKAPELNGWLSGYVWLGALLGPIASGAYFFVQIGALIEDGIWAMFDADMVDFMWQEAAGAQLRWSLIGWGLALAGLLLYPFVKKSCKPCKWLLAGWGSALLVILYGHTLTGHAVTEPWWFRLVLIVHLGLAALWFGALLPLWRFSHVCAEAGHGLKVQNLLESFGRRASVFVPVLLLCGAALSWQLTGWQGVFTTTYGQVLLYKVAFVMAILALAAWHKWVLVPGIVVDGTDTMSRSILVEAAIALCILVATAYLSTFFSPH